MPARRTLDELLTQHLGEASPLRTLLSPDEGNAFIEALRGQVAQALAAQSEHDRRRVLARPQPTARCRAWCAS